MKLAGDVTESEKKLAQELVEAEEYWDSKNDRSYAVQTIAKAYVCLAHDWYQLGAEEKGHSLLEKAEKICPGYFKNVMIQQTLEDSDFNVLVRQLSVELAWMVISRINEMKGSA